MSSFGNATEASEGYVNKLYTGVENFRATHVCPAHEALKKMYGENAKADDYTLVSQDGHQQVKIVIYLDNEAEEGEDSIKTRITFFVTNAGRLTKDGTKTQYINRFGQTAWLPQGATPAASGDYEISGPKGTYVFKADGARPAYQGEEELISFLRNLLNLPSPEKVDNPDDAASQFSVDDWNAMFSGNFSSVQGAVASSPNKIGILMGVKITDEGKMYQDVFNRSTLRQWAKSGGKFEYLRNKVLDAQNNGAYPKTNFGPSDFTLREYTADAAPTPAAAIQETKAAPTGFFAQAENFGG